jgi:hypothetical protein
MGATSTIQRSHRATGWSVPAVEGSSGRLGCREEPGLSATERRNASSAGKKRGHRPRGRRRPVLRLEQEIPGGFIRRAGAFENCGERDNLGAGGHGSSTRGVGSARNLGQRASLGYQGTWWRAPEGSWEPGGMAEDAGGIPGRAAEGAGRSLWARQRSSIGSRGARWRSLAVA